MWKKFHPAFSFSSTISCNPLRTCSTVRLISNSLGENDVLVRKEVTRPGDYFYLGNDGSPRKLTVTPDETPFDGSKVGVRYLFDKGQEMIADGLPIPVPINHDFSAHPLTPQEEVTNNAGFVQSYEMDGDKLFAHLDIAEHKINRDDLSKTIKWTSPWFNSFPDGRGKQWNGVVSHIALTTRPRMIPQEPFPSVAFAISSAKPAPASQSGFAVSRAGLIKDNKPVYPIAFSLYSGIPMAEGEFPSEKFDKKPKKDKGGDSEGKSKGKSSKPPREDGDDLFSGSDEGDSSGDEGGDYEEGGKAKPMHKFDPETGEPIETPLVDPDGDVSVYSVIAELLEILEPPIMLGEDVTPENFCEKLFKAVMDAVKSKGTTMPQEPLPEQNKTPDMSKPTGGGTNPIVQEQAPLYMSLTPEQAKAALAKVTDPGLRSLISMAFSQQEKTLKTAEALKKHALAQAKARRDRRIEALASRLPQNRRDQLLAMSQGMQFSLTDEGVFSDPMESMLDIMEAAIKQQPDLLGGGITVSQPHPVEYTGALTDDRADALAGEMCESVGVPTK